MKTQIILCPKCGSSKTKKTSITSIDFKTGQHECMACGYKHHWLKFSSKWVDEGSLILHTREENS